MIIFRLVQGLAGAAMVPSSQAIMMETFRPEEQQMAMATWGVGMMVAPVAGCLAFVAILWMLFLGLMEGAVGMGLATVGTYLVVAAVLTSLRSGRLR